MNRIPNAFGGRIVHHTQVPSTMDVAKRLSGTDAAHGAVVTADYQSCGRGSRPGREWDAVAGKNLLCTVILEESKIDVPVARIPLLTGLAIARTVERYIEGDCSIKWPNDVLVDGKKTAGVLCEFDGNRIFVGVGINCNQRKFPDDLRRPATSIGLITRTDTDIATLLESFLCDFVAALADESWRDQIHARLLYLDRLVRIETATHLENRSNADAGDASVPVEYERGETFRITGIGDEGELIAMGTTGEKRFFAGEVIAVD